MKSESGNRPNGAFDIVIIGGGINGCCIARDAAGRGYSVLLAEINDLASGTSSGSTKLIHGGLRYLEHFRLRLVRESLIEREILWSNAPHIISPLRFLLPHHEGLRPRWLLRVGLFLYDHLGGRKMLPPTATIDLRRDPAGQTLKPLFRTAFEYSDCWVDDARLVVLNARDAADRGAAIRTRTEVMSARRDNGSWQVELRPASGETAYTVTARLVVNAAGPWADRVAHRLSGANAASKVRLVRGSHIVVCKLFDDPRSFTFQNTDGRIVFAIPYEDDYTLIGTTDRDYAGDPGTVAIATEEIDYLCATVNEYFEKEVKPDDIVWSYSGVRLLFDDGASPAQEATRDYVLQQDGDARSGALINVFGGKITTCRTLSEEVLGKVETLLGKRGPAWTAAAPLPGGDFPATRGDDQRRRLLDDYPFLDDSLAARLVRTYGTRTRSILGNAKTIGELGRHFGAGLYEAEIRYLVNEEWAKSAEDVLWRRTKRGLGLSADEAQNLEVYIASIQHGEAADRAGRHCQSKPL